MAVPQLKRGHNKDFGLTRSEIADVIKSTRSIKTKAILILASRGLAVREIAKFRVPISTEDPRLLKLNTLELVYLTEFPEGFGISSVAIWRRVKKALLRASQRGIIKAPPDRLPFPEALRVTKPDPVLREKVVSLSVRVHDLSRGIPHPKVPLEECTHAACNEVRELLEMIDRERRIV